MEKKQKTSLTWQLILTMVVIVAGTVAMCWFFNTTFLEKYYIFHKEKELKSSFDQVRLICEKQGDSSDDAYVQFERICANGNINMLIADQDRNLIWSSYSSAQRFQMQMEDWLYGSDRSRVQVLSSGKDYTLLRQTDERLQSEYLVLLGTLKNGNNLYMRAAVESIRESASITNQFFVMVSTGAIILSVILIIVLSKGISHPIHALSDIARRMTQLDFDAKYIPVRHVSREIDELGNSMNELSETLEETISELKTANVSLQQDIEKKEQIDDFTKLNVDFEDFDLDIRTSDDDHYYMEYKLEKNGRKNPLTWKDKDGELTLEEPAGGSGSYYITYDLGIFSTHADLTEKKDALNTVVLYIPEKAQLSEAELQLSDGDLAADQLLCKEMTLELLSGDLMLDKGEFEKFDAKLSDGDLNVKELQCTDNMQLKSGNGDVTIKKEELAEGKIAISDEDIQIDNSSFNGEMKINSACGYVSVEMKNGSAEKTNIYLKTADGDVDTEGLSRGKTDNEEDTSVYENKAGASAPTLNVECSDGDITLTESEK